MAFHIKPKTMKHMFIKNACSKIKKQLQIPYELFVLHSGRPYISNDACICF